ncbi:hypothetical protein, partial [Rothia sp. ND6WE1A]|uniref:hypothetical protein n=1 Tax=Rothia sp. ND6WE1A TaxID=1848190 RepID=UPI0013019BD0
LDDNIELDNIKKEIKQSIHIDLFNTRYKYSEPIYSYEDFIKNKYGIIHLIKRVLVYPCKKILMSDKDKLNFKNYVYRLYLYPKIISSKPFRGDYGKKDAVFGLMIYQNLKMEYIPIIFAAHDQISLMNADSLIESIKSHSKSRIVVGLWPDKEFGVTIQEGIGGGTRRKQDKQVEEEYGLDNIIYETRGANMDHDSDDPRWFDEWCARNNL